MKSMQTLQQRCIAKDTRSLLICPIVLIPYLPVADFVMRLLIINSVILLELVVLLLVVSQ